MSNIAEPATWRSMRAEAGLVGPCKKRTSLDRRPLVLTAAPVVLVIDDRSTLPPA
ncbi:MAG: hypothetical protein M3Y69_09105 [Verrucomicrobiota bacterium]|nr:hypothetical protein [Verrucomicrobiota bacterium]